MRLFSYIIGAQIKVAFTLQILVLSLQGLELVKSFLI